LEQVTLGANGDCDPADRPLQLVAVRRAQLLGESDESFKHGTVNKADNARTHKGDEDLRLFSGTFDEEI